MKTGVEWASPPARFGRQIHRGRSGLTITAVAKRNPRTAEQANAEANTPGLVVPWAAGRTEAHSTEAMAARASWHSKTAIDVIGLSGDGHEVGCNHHQCHGAHRSENGIGVGANHLSSRELLAAVITHGLPSASPRMPRDPGVETWRSTAAIGGGPPRHWSEQPRLGVTHDHGWRQAVADRHCWAQSFFAGSRIRSLQRQRSHKRLDSPADGDFAREGSRPVSGGHDLLHSSCRSASPDGPARPRLPLGWTGDAVAAGAAQSL